MKILLLIISVLLSSCATTKNISKNISKNVECYVPAGTYIAKAQLNRTYCPMAIIKDWVLPLMIIREKEFKCGDTISGLVEHPIYGFGMYIVIKLELIGFRGYCIVEFSNTCTGIYDITLERKKP